MRCVGGCSKCAAGPSHTQHECASLLCMGLTLWAVCLRGRYGLERLNEYAVRAGHATGPALAALNRHFGPHGERAPKDTALFGLVSAGRYQRTVESARKASCEHPSASPCVRRCGVRVPRWAWAAQ